MITTKISPDFKNFESGIYLIYFSDGRFYIGSSKHLQRRVHAHILSIKSDFSVSGTCKSLKCMKGFMGEAIFYLLEYIPVQNKCFAIGGHLIKRENEYISNNLHDPMLLNKGLGKRSAL